MALQGVKYPVDIVICIDATGSMGPVINTVKTNALKFHEDLRESMDKKGKIMDDLRVKVVVFRDYYCDTEPMKESPFFKLPGEKEAFSNFVNAIVADGGGDEPENGLEALSIAIRSDWRKTVGKQRQIVVVYTDASTHKLEKPGKPANYPPGIAKDFNELTDWWEGQEYVSTSAKRIILFAPDAYPWTDIHEYWRNVVLYPSAASEGLSEIDNSEIIEVIANSV